MGCEPITICFLKNNKTLFEPIGGMYYRKGKEKLKVELVFNFKSFIEKEEVSEEGSSLGEESYSD